MSPSGGQRRRRLVGRAAGSPGCGEKDAFVTRRLCRDGIGWVTPGCGGGGGDGGARSVGEDSAGFSLGTTSALLLASTAAALLLLLAVLVGWCQRWATLRRLSRIPALEQTFDPERPLRSSLKQRRKQRRIQRLLRLRRQQVHFNEAVDVNEYHGMSATTLTSTSDGRAATPVRRGRQGSVFVSHREETSDEDADEEGVSGREDASHLGTSTEDDKDK